VIHQIKPAKHHLKSLGDLLQQRKGYPELPLKTMPVLSDKMWGIAPRELTVVGARTSQGKTSFSLQVCADLAAQGVPTLYLSLEMTVLSILERMFCNHCHIPNFKLNRGEFHQYADQWQKFTEHINSIPLMITEGLGKKWSDIDTLIERLEPKPRVIILDYIQCIAGSGLEKREVIDEYIRHFRDMAIKHNFAGILCSQINRSGAAGDDNNEPQLHHLKGSGYIEELADKIILMHWPHFYNAKEDINKYLLILAKNRNGRTGRVGIRYIPEYYKFEDEVQVIKPPDAKTQEIAEFFGGTVMEQTKSPKE
jgi:replicative DNA helicase